MLYTIKKNDVRHNIIPDLAVFKRDYAQEVTEFMEIFWIDDFLILINIHVQIMLPPFL